MYQMREFGEKEQEKKKMTEVQTFSVPFDLVEIKKNFTLNTNHPSKPSKDQLINQAFKFHSEGNMSEAAKYYQYFIDQGFKDHKVFCNYGVILKKIGKLKEAEKLYRKAIALNSHFAEAYLNLGNILRDLGNLQKAENSYRKAIEIDPHFLEAYLNLGNILTNLGNIQEAEELYGQAIALNPTFADAAWNLYGLSNSIKQAEERINQCLNMDKSHLKAKLTLSALKLHQGDQSLFNNLMESSHHDHPMMRSFRWTSTLENLPELFFHRWALFDSMINKSKQDRPFYEFGVWRGASFKYLINTFKKGFGFDTFEGLPEAWHNQKIGAYSAEGIIPRIDDGIFVKGKFEETLPTFFSSSRPMASIINFDADLYSSTLCALNYSKPVIDQHTILIFDEFIINGNWEQDEYKALNEFCSKNNLNYEVLAVSYMTKQVAVKLLGISTRGDNK